MKIGFIGAGRLANALAPLFVAAGHEVGLSNSRHADSLTGLSLVLMAHAMTPMEAATFSDIVVLAIPFGAYRSIPRYAVIGKIVIDAMNYFPDRDGNFPEITAQGKTSSELVDEYLPGARVVKAFNTIHHEHIAALADNSLPIEQRRAVYIASDDTGAKHIVGRLIQEIGFAAANTGGLRDGGRRQQPESVVYNKNFTIVQARSALRQAAK